MVCGMAQRSMNRLGFETKREVSRFLFRSFDGFSVILDLKGGILVLFSSHFTFVESDTQFRFLDMVWKL
jgi:hypothetical protein